MPMWKFHPGKSTVMILVSILAGSFLIAFLLRKQSGLVFTGMAVELLLSFVLAAITGMAQTSTT